MLLQENESPTSEGRFKSFLKDFVEQRNVGKRVSADDDSQASIRIRSDR